MANSYRFGDDRQISVLLGLGARQVVPLAGGFVWLALFLQAGSAPVGAGGLAVCLVAGFGRWRGFPLTEIAVPAARHLARTHRRGGGVWVRHSLLGAGPGVDVDVPAEFAGLDLLEIAAPNLTGTSHAGAVGVVHDRHAQTVSLSMRITGRGFAVADPDTQDRLVAGWGTVLSPLARERCPIVKVVWQQWAHPAGIGDHHDFLATCPPADTNSAVADYHDLLARQAPFTVAHEVLVTLVVDIARVRARRRIAPLDAAIDALVEETRLFIARTDTAELAVDTILSPAARATAIRMRCDPRRTRTGQLATLQRSLAAASGRGVIEWGPMAIHPAWGHVQVDGSVHRSYPVAAWPMLPMSADWLGHLLTGADQATRTVTVVMEPVPMRKAAQAANRELASLEADASEKEERRFRVTARERRRMADVETREQELAVGHAEFAFVGIVTVTATDIDQLDDSCALVEQAAAQALMDLRPLDARHTQGLIAALPLGRDVKTGRWT